MAGSVLRKDHRHDSKDSDAHKNAESDDPASKDDSGVADGTVHATEIHGTTHNKVSSKKHRETDGVATKLVDETNNPEIPKKAVDDT